MDAPQIYQMPAMHLGDDKQLPAKAILHTMGEYIEHNGRIYSAKDWLDVLRLSVHFTITPSGVICQHLPLEIMGAHAKDHNTNSVGVELLLAGVWTDGPFRDRIQSPYTYGDQYTAAVALGRWLHGKGLSFHRHSDIDQRIEGGRKVKVDPGDGFPYVTYLSDITR